MDSLIQYSYIVAAALFIYGLKQLGSPATARRGRGNRRVGWLAALHRGACHDRRPPAVDPERNSHAAQLLDLAGLVGEAGQLAQGVVVKEQVGGHAQTSESSGLRTKWPPCDAGSTCV